MHFPRTHRRRLRCLCVSVPVFEANSGQKEAFKRVFKVCCVFVCVYTLHICNRLKKLVRFTPSGDSQGSS